MDTRSTLNTGKLRLRPIAQAIAMGSALALVPLASHALIIDSHVDSFTSSVTVTDTDGGGAATSTITPSQGITRFDNALGVLISATTLDVTSTRTQTTTASTTTNGKTVTNKGESTGSLAISGLTVPLTQTFSKISQTATCTDSSAIISGCSVTVGPTGTATNAAALAIASADLNAFVQPPATQTATLTSAISSSVTSNGTGTGSYTLDWAGKITTEYSYMLHAVASFDDGASQTVLTLDFGTFAQGSGVQTLGFSIFNQSGDRVGLDLDSIGAGTGATSTLYHDLSIFSALAAGSSDAFNAFFDTSAIGLYSATYMFTLSDADLGASASRHGGYSLTLNLLGSVVGSDSTDVPEPGTLSLLGLGMAWFGLRKRRRALNS